VTIQDEDPVQTGLIKQPSLRRALGRWDLTAIGINQVIGGAIFLMPAVVAREVGNWAPIALLAIGLASLCVALCFAEVGSRFEGTGGPYLYTRAAFGRFVAFEVGWMQWFTRATSQASIANGLALALGFYWPVVTSGLGRASVISGITLGLLWINVRGIRQSAWVVNALTIGKLVPLFVFILGGLLYLQPERLLPLPSVTIEQASTAALLLIFTFGGYDVIGVPAGEATDPRRHIPFAFVTTMIVVTVVLVLAQVVTMSVLPDVAASTTPMADASALIFGAAGALMISVGSVVSMTGNNAGQVLTGSRMLYALAEHDELPRWFARIHPAYRTPHHCVIFTTIVALILMLTGSFVFLAAVSAVARLITYLGACGAMLMLRRPQYAGQVQPPTFVVPGGALVPALAIGSSMLILVMANRQQLLSGAAALTAGAFLFILNDRLRSRASREPVPVTP
jgi:APA family basic amino acid/polyamine antiporter